MKKTGDARTTAFLAACTVLGLSVSGIPSAASATPAASVASPAPANVVKTVAAKATLSWHFQSASISVGQKPVVIWSARKVPSKGKIYLQRKMGTAGKFTSIKRLGKSGTYTAPSVGQGQQTYRIVIRNKKKQTVRSLARSLRVYANIPLARFLDSSEYTETVNGHVVRYVRQGWRELLSASGSSCRSMTLTTTAGAYGNGRTPAHVVVALEVSDPVSYDLPYGTAQTRTVPLRGGFSVSNDAVDGERAYVNATLSCYTWTGSPVDAN